MRPWSCSQDTEGSMLICIKCRFFFTVISENLTIVTETEHETLYTGDNLTLPCTILGGYYNAFLNPVIWYKIQPNSNKTVQINTGTLHHLRVKDILK